MADIAVDPALAQIPHPYALPPSLPILPPPSNQGASTSYLPPATARRAVNGFQREASHRPSGARPAIPEDPSIRPFGCNAPSCLPSLQEYHVLRSQYENDLRAWNAEHARLQANPATAGQRPRWRHPSLNSSGVCFNASRELLEHVREQHRTRSNGERIQNLEPRSDPNSIPVNPQFPNGADDERNQPSDGKLFRCALVGCQRTWKVRWRTLTQARPKLTRCFQNCHGLQYHTLTSLTAEEHSTGANAKLLQKQAPLNPVYKRKAEAAEAQSWGSGGPGSVSEDDGTGEAHPCPYKSKRGCTRQYKHRGGVRHHVLQAHGAEPDLPAVLDTLPPDISGGPPPGKRQRVVLFNDNLKAAAAPLNPRASVNAQHLLKHPRPTPPAVRAPAPLLTPRAPAVVVPPYSGMYTHGYVFSGASLPFRGPKRPIDALYYLNVLAGSGQKTPAQRSTERAMTNALLSPDVVKALQEKAAPDIDEEELDVLDEWGMLREPRRVIRPANSDERRPFGREDVECAIAKIAKTLAETGFGDAHLPDE